MVQEDYTKERVDVSAGSIIGNYNKNTCITTTCCWTTVLTIESKLVRKSTFMIHNSGSCNDLSYRIWGTLERIRSATIDNDNGWAIIGSETTVTSGAVPSIETVTDQYSYIIVQVKNTIMSQPTTAKIWHRGET